MISGYHYESSFHIEFILLPFMIVTVTFMQSLIAVSIRNIHAYSAIAYMLFQGYKTAFSAVCVEVVPF